MDESIFKFPDPLPDHGLPKLNELRDLVGMFETTTTVPTTSPRNAYEQIKLYTDSLTAPSVYKLYIFLPKINVWKSVTLS